jgi:outer membrane protein assembly factor BamB
MDLLIGVHEDGRRPLATSVPAVRGGTAFVPVGGELLAVALDSPEDGPIWKYEFNINSSIESVPALACGAIFAGNLNRLVALDPTSGDQYWRADVGSHQRTALALRDETVYIAQTGHSALEARTGTVRWHAGGGDTLAVGDDGVYTTQNINGTGGIFAHDLNGEERWHLPLGKIVGSTSVLNGRVWVGDNDGMVYAIDAETGETEWSRSPTGVGKIHSGVAVSGEDLIVPAGHGEVTVALDVATGETMWTAETGMVTSRPVVGEDWVGVGRTNTGVTIYDRSTGEERVSWSRAEYGLGTVDGLVPVDKGFIVRDGTTSGLSLLR